MSCEEEAVAIMIGEKQAYNDVLYYIDCNMCHSCDGLHCEDCNINYVKEYIRNKIK